VSVKVVWTAGAWANAVADLPAEGPLPCRTVLVPRMQVAHVLRRELVRAARAAALAGTRFLTAPLAAAAVLRRTGTAFEPGEEALRPARLLSLFRGDLGLDHFPVELLRSRPGWHDAFARTVSDLEAAAFRPEDLERDAGSARLRDIARVWRALDESAGSSWTVERTHLEAAAALERQPDLWPFEGGALVYGSGNVTAAQVRFQRAIRGASLVLLGARPMRPRHLERMVALFGDAAGAALAAAETRRDARTERDILASYLFEQPAALAAPERPRSGGPDGTVDIEEHAGIEEEVEATADWVARQVEAGSPLEEIAVLVPSPDPLAGLVAERLARLPWHNGPFPVHVAGGLPLAGTATGARALSVVRAIRSHLSADALADVLPALRANGPEARYLTRGAAMDLAWSLGTTGGNPARPEGALEWPERAAARETALDAQLAEAKAADAAGTAPGLARKARDIERLLADLRAVRPALDALVSIARHTVGRAPLATLWPALRSFLGQWLPGADAGAGVDIVLDERLDKLASDRACGSVAGEDALRVIEDAISTTRVSEGRFGDPAVYVGPVREARDLAFEAVRVVGLAEGYLPSVPREDAVLPDALRAALSARAGASPSTAADHATADLHALDSIVRNARARVSLSAPRLDAERSQHEPSSIILEAAAALARPDASTGERGPPIPDLRTLRRDGFAPAREAARRFRAMRPVTETAWQDRVARGLLDLPPRWRGRGALDLDRVAGLLRPDEPGPIDGVLRRDGATIAVPGLSADRPISPGALGRLLGCPHQFLLADLLRFDQPAEAPPRREIGQPYYGDIFHAVAAEFYGSHGATFGRERALADWLAIADGIVDRAFAALLERYPLVGEAVRDQQRERLRRDVHDLLRYDWEGASDRRFVDVERVFGHPDAVRLTSGDHTLFVRGRIDRIDVEHGRTLVRDLKTGRPHPRIGREAEPDAAIDIQIAAYGMVARALADAWQLPPRVAAAYAYVGRGASERAFRDDFHEVLEPAAVDWLRTAADLLAGRAFPRTPRLEDCRYCPFRPVCGDAYGRAADVLAREEGLARFAALKGAFPGDEE